LTPSSNLRTNALAHLVGGKKTLDDLRSDLNTSSTTISHELRELEEESLISEDAERHYFLTTIGKIVARKLIDFNDTAETLHTFESFWLEHDVSGIPNHLLERIGCLRGTTLVNEGAAETLKTFKTFTGFLESAMMIRLITTFIIKMDWSPGESLFIEGPDIQNIVTSDALDAMLETTGCERIAEALHNGLTLYVTKKNPKRALTVTDRHMVLGLYHLVGYFDVSRMLVSDRAEGIEWGHTMGLLSRDIGCR
jgi:predicted transcriptional regulator